MGVLQDFPNKCSIDLNQYRCILGLPQATAAVGTAWPEAQRTHPTKKSEPGSPGQQVQKCALILACAPDEAVQVNGSKASKQARHTHVAVADSVFKLFKHHIIHTVSTELQALDLDTCPIGSATIC
eukprot:scaffold192599_cov21-Tisochrysis_lutea.AAC.1